MRRPQDKEGAREEGRSRVQALDELQQRASALGAHAIVGVDMDYEVLGPGNMLMVTASGTAVTVEAV